MIIKEGAKDRVGSEVFFSMLLLALLCFVLQQLVSPLWNERKSGTFLLANRSNFVRLRPAVGNRT